MQINQIWVPKKKLTSEYWCSRTLKRIDSGVLIDETPALAICFLEGAANKPKISLSTVERKWAAADLIDLEGDIVRLMTGKTQRSSSPRRPPDSFVPTSSTSRKILHYKVPSTTYQKYF